MKEPDCRGVKKKTKMEEKKNDLCARLFEFAVRVIEFLKTTPNTPENRIIRGQFCLLSCASLLLTQSRCNNEKENCITKNLPSWNMEALYQFCL